MWYLSHKSFLRIVLLIAFLDLKRCDPQGNAGEDIRPQDILPPGMTVTPAAAGSGGGGEGGGGGGGGKVGGDKAEAQKHRFTTPSTTMKTLFRTTPLRVSFKEHCDYLAHYCLKAYDTGMLCGRTLYYGYYTFRNYCLLDYVNCRERYEVWQVVHMGECFNVRVLRDYLLYPYDDDYFLDQYYVLEDHR